MIALPTRGAFVYNDIFKHIVDTVLADYILNTLLLLFLTGVWTTIWGVGTAYVVTNYRLKFQSILKVALLLPFACPGYLLGYFLIDTLQFTMSIRTIFWASFVLGISLYPYVYMSCLSGFSMRNICLEEASQMLGRSPLQTFWKITLKGIRPFYAAGLGLVFMEALNDYGVVDHFAVDTFTTGIYRSWFGLYSLPTSVNLSLMLLIFTFLGIALESWGRRKKAFANTTSRVQMIELKELNTLKHLLAFFFCFIPIFIGFVFPLYYCLKQIFIYEGYVYFNEEFVTLIKNSFYIAIFVSAICISLAIVNGFTSSYFKNMFLKSFIRFSAFGYAIPGSIIAISIIVVFQNIDDLAGKNLLVGGQILLVYSLVCRFFAISYENVLSSQSLIPENLKSYLKLNTNSFMKSSKDLYLPYAKGAILTSAVVIFVDVLKELPATMILSPINFQTLSVNIYTLASDERLVESAPSALCILLAGVIPLIFLGKKLDTLRLGDKD